MDTKMTLTILKSNRLTENQVNQAWTNFYLHGTKKNQDFDGEITVNMLPEFDEFLKRTCVVTGSRVLKKAGKSIGLEVYGLMMSDQEANDAVFMSYICSFASEVVEVVMMDFDDVDNELPHFFSL